MTPNRRTHNVAYPKHLKTTARGTFCRSARCTFLSPALSRPISLSLPCLAFPGQYCVRRRRYRPRSALPKPRRSASSCPHSRLSRTKRFGIAERRRLRRLPTQYCSWPSKMAICFHLRTHIFQREHRRFPKNDASPPLEETGGPSRNSR